MSNSANSQKSDTAMSQFLASLPEEKAVEFLSALGEPNSDEVMEGILTMKEYKQYKNARTRDEFIEDGRRLLEIPPLAPIETAPVTQLKAVISLGHSVESILSPHIGNLEKKHNAVLYFENDGHEITIVSSSEDSLVSCQLDIWDIIGKEQRECRCIYKPEVIEHYHQMSAKDRAEFHNATKSTFKIIDKDNQSMLLICAFSSLTLDEVVANIDTTASQSAEPQCCEPVTAPNNQPTLKDSSYFDSIFETRDNVPEVSRRLGEITLTSRVSSGHLTPILQPRTTGSFQPSTQGLSSPTTPIPTPRQVNFAPNVDIRTFEPEHISNEATANVVSDCISLNCSQQIMTELLSEEGRLENYLKRQFGTGLSITKSFGGLAIRLSASNDANLFLAKEYIWEKLSSKQQMHKVLHKNRYLRYWYDLSKQEKLIFFSKTEVTLDIKNLDVTANLVIRAFNEMALEKALNSLDELIKYNMKPSHLP